MLKYIKIEGKYWQKLHVYNWQKSGKRILKNKIFIPKSDDTLNADPSNWRQINRSKFIQLKNNGKIKNLCNHSKQFIFSKIRFLSNKEKPLRQKVSKSKEKKNVEEKYNLKETAIKPVSTLGLKEVKIPELKMSVWVKPSRNEEEVRAKYLNRRQRI